MENIMKLEQPAKKHQGAKLISLIYEYITNLKYIIFLLLSLVSSYTFFLTNYSVSVDDFSGDRYYFGQLFAQGRMTSTLIRHIFGLINNNYWFIDFIGIVFLGLSAIVFCIVFDRVIKTKSLIPQVVFSCLLVTSPLHTEIFSYTGCTLAVGGGFFLVSCALWFVLNYIESKQKKNLVFASVMVALVSSWYESLVVVYFCAVFAVLILKYISDDYKEKITMKSIFTNGMIFAVPLIAGLVLEFAISFPVSKLVNFTGFLGSANTSGWLTGESAGIFGIVRSWMLKYVLACGWYLPITLFAVSLVVALVLAVYYCKRKKSPLIVLLFAGLYLGVIILSLIFGNCTPYRTAQVVIFFTAFIYFLLAHTLCGHSCKLLFRGACVILAYFIILQITNTNYWFNADYQRYQEEKSVVMQVGNTLYQNYDINKPVVFVGDYELSDNIKELTYIKVDSIPYKLASILHINSVINNDNDGKYFHNIQETNCKSFIKWSEVAFLTNDNKPNTELLKFFSYCGYSDIKQGTLKQYNEAKKLSEAMPEWPQKGSVKDNGEYIIVNF